MYVQGEVYFALFQQKTVFFSIDFFSANVDVKKFDLRNSHTFAIFAGGCVGVAKRFRQTYPFFPSSFLDSLISF